MHTTKLPLQGQFNPPSALSLDLKIAQLESELTPAQRIFYEELLRDQQRAREILAARQAKDRPALTEQAFAEHLARKSAQAKLTLRPSGMRGPSFSQLRDEAGRLAAHQVAQTEDHQRNIAECRLFEAQYAYLQAAQAQREQLKGFTAAGRENFNRNTGHSISHENSR